MHHERIWITLLILSYSKEERWLLSSDSTRLTDDWLIGSATTSSPSRWHIRGWYNLYLFTFCQLISEDRDSGIASLLRGVGSNGILWSSASIESVNANPYSYLLTVAILHEVRNGAHFEWGSVFIYITAAVDGDRYAALNKFFIEGDLLRNGPLEPCWERAYSLPRAMARSRELFV